MPRTTKADLEARNESLAKSLDAAEKEMAEMKTTLRLMQTLLYTVNVNLEGLLLEKKE